MKNSRIIGLDILRIIATFCVIIIHVAAEYKWNESVYSNKWFSAIIYDGISRWSVPVFIMISGVLFLNSGRADNVKNILKSIIRIITAFLFWTVMHVMFDYIQNSSMGLADIMFGLIRGHFHMWFLFAIVGLYLVAPILKYIALNEKICKYFLILSLVCAFLIPSFIEGLLCINNILNNSYMQSFVSAIEANWYDMHFSIPTDYAVYFVLGTYLYNIKQTKRQQRLIYLLSILSFICVVTLTIGISRIQGDTYSGVFSYFNIFVLFESIGIFTFIVEKTRTIEADSKPAEMLGRMSDCCFGVYLMHMILLYYIEKCLGVNITAMEPAIFIPLLSFVILVVGICVTGLIKCIPILKKYIV